MDNIERVFIWASVLIMALLFISGEVRGFYVLLYPAILIGGMFNWIAYKRAGTHWDFLKLCPVKIYNCLLVLFSVSSDSYIDNIECYIEDDHLITEITFLGVTAVASEDLEEVIEDYTTLVGNDGEIELTDDMELSMFGDVTFMNCSTCSDSDSFSRSIDVSMSWIGVSWDMTLCIDCCEEVVRSQLEALSDNSEFKSELVVNQV